MYIIVYIMKVLHVTFHKGCQNDLEYILDRIEDVTHDTFTFDDDGNQKYNITKQRAVTIWNKYKHIFNEYDCIITSDTAPLCRIFIENNWSKKLIVWICNRFDYSHRPVIDGPFPDKDYLEMFQNAHYMKNVRVIGYTLFENIYCKLYYNIDIGFDVITPSGGISNTYKHFTHKPELNNTFFIPPYHNDTDCMNVSNVLDNLKILNYCGRYDGPKDLTNYKAVVHIPYAWSNLALFESFALGIIYFIPSIEFLIEISKKPKFFWTPPYRSDLVHHSEWYNSEYENLFIYFNSWEDLLLKMSDLDYDKHKVILKEFSNKKCNDCIQKWKRVITN